MSVAAAVLSPFLRAGAVTTKSDAISFTSAVGRSMNIASFVAKEWTTPNRRIAGHLIPEGTPILLANTVAFLDEKYFPDPSKYETCSLVSSPCRIWFSF